VTRGRIALLAAGVLLAVLFVLLPAAEASDVFANVAPASQLPSGALVDAYPLGSYLLDHHFDAVKAGVLSGVDVSGIAPMIAWFLAQLLWQLTALLAYAVITLFTFAFSLDLVNGSEATGGNGALAPVSDAIATIYRDVFGQPWMTVAVLLAGMWAMWNALVRRRYTETAGALAISLIYVTIALAFVTQPERTIGTASRWTNEMSGAFLSLSSNGSVSDHDDAKREVSDQLFRLLVYDPWVVLQFGGLEHCVRDGNSVAVRPLSSSPARDAQLSRQLAQGQQIEADGKVCVNNRAKYAPHFLRFDFQSRERDAEYEALKDGDSGKLPDEDPGKRDGTYRLSAVDKPAAEAMGKGGQYQRLGLAIVIFGGELGAFLLLGSLSVAVILAQVLVLLLLAFAPIVLVAAVFPKRGHEFFLGWLQRIVAFLLRKAIYSLILSVLLAVSAALQGATGNLGWLMAFGMQAAFFWAVFLYRKQLAGQLSTAVTGTSREHEATRLGAGGLVAVYAAARVARGVLRLTRSARHQLQPGDTPPPPQPPPPRPEPPADTASDPAQPRPGGPAADAPAEDAPEPSPRPARRSRSSSHRGIDATAILTPRPRADHDDGDRSEPQPRPQDVRPAEGAPASRPAESPSGDRAQPAAPTREETTPPERHEADHGPAARPAEPDDIRARGRSGDPSSPLLLSLHRDAQRLHHDARRVHEDAQRVGTLPDTSSSSAPARPPVPPLPPVRRSPSAPSKDGEAA
jgi:hypothetical protein